MGDYASAWDLAAPNRVDLNVLVDYGWPSFLANAPAVVEALRHDSMLSDLLAALRPQNMTAAGALYASMPAYKPPQVCSTLGGLLTHCQCHLPSVNQSQCTMLGHKEGNQIEI